MEQLIGGLVGGSTITWQMQKEAVVWVENLGF